MYRLFTTHDSESSRKSGRGLRLRRTAARAAAALFAFILCATAVPLPAHALPPCRYEHCTFTGEDCYAPGSIEASCVDYIQGKWKCDTRLAKNGALCGRWSNMVRYEVASKMSTKYYTGLKFNKKNFLKVCKGAKVGTKLVLGQAKWEDGSLSHAIVLLKVTSREVWWADCNWNHDNVIHYRHGSVDDFINFYHYKSSKYSYLHFVVKVEKYKKFPEPVTVSCDPANSGAARIAWTKVSGAKEYKVYRAASRKGKYKLVATVTDACSYTDAEAKPGSLHYYKVKAVKRSGKNVKGNLVSARSRLDRPHVRISFKNGSKGRLKWKAIEGAASYIVYRRYGENGSWQKMKTVKTTSYTDSKLVKSYSSTSYWYKVCAVQKGNSKAKSLYSPWVTPTRYAWVP